MLQTTRNLSGLKQQRLISCSCNMCFVVWLRVFILGTRHDLDPPLAGPGGAGSEGREAEPNDNGSWNFDAGLLLSVPSCWLTGACKSFSGWGTWLSPWEGQQALGNKSRICSKDEVLRTLPGTGRSLQKWWKPFLSTCQKGKSQHRPHKGVQVLGEVIHTGPGWVTDKGQLLGIFWGTGHPGARKGSQQQLQKTREHVVTWSQRVSGARMGKDVPVSGVRDQSRTPDSQGPRGSRKCQLPPPARGQRGQCLAHTTSDRELAVCPAFPGPWGPGRGELAQHPLPSQGLCGSDCLPGPFPHREGSRATQYPPRRAGPEEGPGATGLQWKHI